LLHVGSLVQIMMLRRLQQAGHKPIVLMGGGTTKVGDPSGKRREPQDAHERGHQRQHRLASARSSTSCLTFGDGPTDAVMVNNDDWLERARLRRAAATVGPHFTGQPDDRLVILGASSGSSASSR